MGPHSAATILVHIHTNLVDSYYFSVEWIRRGWTGDDEKAAAAFRAALKTLPEYADAHQNLGAVLTASDPAEAVRELEKAVSLDPSLLKAQYNLALAYEASPSYGEARAVQQLRKFQMARADERLGNLAPAAEALNGAIAINSHSSSYYYVLATVYRKLGKQEESRKAMESFTRLDRENNELEQKRRDFFREEANGEGGAHE